jgi:hypothetical protein
MGKCWFNFQRRFSARLRLRKKGIKEVSYRMVEMSFFFLFIRTGAMAGSLQINSLRILT